MRFGTVLCLLLLACLPKTKTSTPKSASIGRIEAIEGKPTRIRAGVRSGATAGAPVNAGDKLETDATAKVQVKLNDASVLAVGPGSVVSLAQFSLGSSRQCKVHVDVGKFWLRISRWIGAGESYYEVTTPTAVAGARGTTLWGDTQVDAVCALDGHIEVKNRQRPDLGVTQLETGHCASELSLGKMTPLAPSSEQIAGFLKEVLISPP